MKPLNSKQVHVSAYVPPNVYEALRFGAAGANQSGSQFVREILSRWARKNFPQLFHEQETPE